MIWLTIATSIAVSRSKGIMVDQLRGPMSFIWRWWGVLLFFLFPIPLLIFWVVAGRPSLAGALAALVVLLLATVRVAFRNKRMPPS